MLQELNRRLDAIGGYIDGVNERSEANMPPLAPPYPNRLIRRQQIEKQIEESLFSPNLHELHNSIPSSYMGPEFIRQLLEAETQEEKIQEIKDNRKVFALDHKEYVSVMAQRKSEKAEQHV